MVFDHLADKSRRESILTIWPEFIPVADFLRRSTL